ncbi:MAG: CBS domain-containing protein [Dehalococcoidia bacterium]
MICPACRFENIEGADDCVNCGEPLYGLDLPEMGIKDPAPSFIQQPIAGLPKRPPVTINIDDPVSLAVRVMRQQGVRSLLVMDGTKLAGIITGSDLLKKVAGPHQDLTAFTCRQIMTPDPVCLEEDDSIALAINMMASGDFRHLPILRDGVPVTVIGVNDVFMYISPNMV